MEVPTGLEHVQQVRLQNASHTVEQLKLGRVSIEGKVVQVVAEGVCVAVAGGKSVVVVGYPSPGKVAEGDVCRFQVVDDGTVSSVMIQGAPLTCQVHVVSGLVSR